MDKVYDWHFPLVRTHAGMLLGNGTLGVMVWGEGNVLRLTIGRADFWDHRGGTAWTERMNYREIRRLLEAGDEAGIRAIFAAPDRPGEPGFPTVLPIGRVELVFDPSVKLRTGHLHIGSGRIAIDLDRTTPTAGSVRVELELSMHAPVLHVLLPEGLDAPKIRPVTAWEHCAAELKHRGIPRAQVHGDDQAGGWVQPRVAVGDRPLAVEYARRRRELWVTVDYISDAGGTEARQQLNAAIERGAEQMRSDNAAWWRDYWANVPRVDLPHERLSFLYHYGMYKFAGLTAPQGVAATLQGPWIEEYQLPPWSSDYHFNINVQMCYWPAYAGNRLAHLRPMFDLVWSWRDRMREHARLFVGIDDGLVLPHAVSDECIVIGSFWTGTIDHACTGWVGKMMFDYYRMTGDVQFLRERAYPFMYGAMRVFEEMLERRPDGSFVLPVSVSPEYGAAEMWAWGRNASFQVGCIHMLIESLLHACDVLGESPRPIWRDIQQHLPKASVQDTAGRPRIALWEGQDLDESHRHHSHWAGLYPWDVIDLDDPHWRQIVRNTYDHWIRQGMGQWSGWCIPWAAMLHARVGCPDAAVALLEYWEHLYTNEGHGTLHDPKLPKANVTGRPLVPSMPPPGQRGEIMQMDAGMAVCAAVMDLLVHTRRGVHYLLQGVPAGWRNLKVDGIRTEGGFLVGLTCADGQLAEVRIHSDLGQPFRLRNPWPDRVAIRRGSQTETVGGRIIELPTTAGEVIVLSES